MRSYARVNNLPAVTLAVQKESAANTVRVSNAVRRALVRLADKLPEDIELVIVNDNAEFIKKAIGNLKSVAVEGALLAMIIIFLFLATLRGTLIAGISIPLSILATFALMYLNNMTLNMITMGGLVLAIGRMIDDSVVVLENIYRHMELGEEPDDAAINAVGELAMAITATTLTTLCVFIPLALVGGLVSTFFTPMALVVTFGLIASLLVAFTVTPSLSATFLRAVMVQREASPDEQTRGALFVLLSWWRGVIAGLTDWYRTAIDWCLHHRSTVVGVAVGTFAISIMLVGMKLVGLAFFPDTDMGVVQFVAEVPVGSSIEHTNQVAGQLEEITRQVEEAEATLVTVG